MSKVTHETGDVRQVIEQALRKARKFIEYARYELEPGEMQPGDQFPRQGCADKEMARIDAALESLTAQPAPSGWQSIETAPKRGEVLLRVKMRAGIPGGFLVGHYMPGGHCIEDHPAIDGGWYFWNGCMFDKAAEPTHWMPLPPAPDAKDAEDCSGAIKNCAPAERFHYERVIASSPSAKQAVVAALTGEPDAKDAIPPGPEGSDSEAGH